MKKLRTLTGIVRADLLVRTRGYSFLIILGVTVLLGLTFVPPKNANYGMIDLGDYRGVYNSAWIGASFGLLTSLSVSLFGFYLIRSAVDRDRQTRVGQILAATPISKTMYIGGKALGNFTFLMLFVAILAVAAVVVQVIRGEEAHVDLWRLWAPFLMLTIPIAAVVAAIGILFDTISLLRGGFGNVVYFALWLWSFVAGPIDLIGLKLFQESMGRAVVRAFPGAVPQFGIIHAVKGPLETFRWDGYQWNLQFISTRLVILGIAAAVVLVAAFFFNRFDSAGGFFGALNRDEGEGWKRFRFRGRRAPRGDDPDLAAAPVASSALGGHLTPLDGEYNRFSFLTLVSSEVRLMLKGQRWWWFVIALGLVVLGATTTVEAVREALLPMAWLWPLTVWSQMGARETRFDTGQLLFSAAHPVRRQIPAVWLGGVLVALATGIGAALRFAIAGDANALLAWLIGALFIPTLALALGVWGSSSKLFEVTYCLLWYIGAIEKTPALDFLGVTKTSMELGIPGIFLVLTVCLFVAALAGRRRQIYA